MVDFAERVGARAARDGTEESDDPDEVFCRDDLELEIFGEDEPAYEHAAPYEGMFRGFRNLRGEEVAE